MSILLAILMAILPVAPGNIDIDNRVIVDNGNGYSTELSFSVEIDELEVLLPRVIDGKIVDEESAIEYYLQTGEHLGKFSSVESAELYAEVLHLRQQERYGR